MPLPSKCGKEVSEDAKFCYSCGYDFRQEKSLSMTTSHSQSVKTSKEQQPTPTGEVKLSTKRKSSMIGKVILIIVIIFGVLFFIGLLAEVSVPESHTASKTTSVGTTKTVFAVGERVVVGNLAYTVEKVSTAKRIGSAYFGVDADGIFVVVFLTIENTGRETVTVTTNILKIQDESGRVYESSNKAWIYLENNLFLKQLQPGLPSKGEAVFDVPKDVGKVYLRVYSDRSAYEYRLIDLGTISMQSSSTSSST